MKIKVCGITNLEDALNAVEAGANALGFVFYEKSPRYIEPFKARQIVDKLPPFIQTVGLFVNENFGYINQVCTNAKMQLAQIIDDDSFTDLQSLKFKYIKVIRVREKKDIQNVDNYVLVDAFVPNFGGEGKRICLDFFDNIDCSKMVLAGGLNENNLNELKSYNFYGLDVSSGVELSKGKKDKQKIINFIKVANEIK